MSEKTTSFIHHLNNKLDNQFWIATFTLLIIIFSYSIYYYSIQTEFKIQTQLQKRKTDAIRDEVEEFGKTSSLISHLIQQNINTKKSKVTDIEQLLKNFLKGSPSQLVYGIGIWYLPYRFDSKKELFGPYVHYDLTNNHEIKLTYEWNTSEYNYPKQQWFNQGLQSNGETTFVSPYFDNDYIYVTASTPFYGSQNEKIGVITVDLILPQLQILIDEKNISDDEIYFIVDDRNHLLAHPRKKEFLKKLESDNTKKSILDYTENDLNDFLDIDISNRISYTSYSPSLGWKIISRTTEQSVLQHTVLIKNTLQILNIIFIISSIIMFFLIRKNKKEREQSNASIEKNRIKMIQSSKMSALGEMAARMAHEINNPLTIIRSKSNYLKKLSESNSASKVILNDELSKIEETTIRISKIISGLRTFAQNDETSIYTLNDLQKILDTTFVLFEQRFKDNLIHFTTDIQCQAKIMCAENKIIQALVNLLNNSVEAISDYYERWIHIKVFKRNNHIVILIIDSGEKIDSSVVEKMMQPFFTTKTSGKSTGLGLSIAKGIIEEHGGTLEYILNQENTTFEITLPISEN